MSTAITASAKTTDAAEKSISTSRKYDELIVASRLHVQNQSGGSSASWAKASAPVTKNTAPMWYGRNCSSSTARGSRIAETTNGSTPMPSPSTQPMPDAAWMNCVHHCVAYMSGTSAPAFANTARPSNRMKVVQLIATPKTRPMA